MIDAHHRAVVRLAVKLVEHWSQRGQSPPREKLPHLADLAILLAQAGYADALANAAVACDYLQDVVVEHAAQEALAQHFAAGMSSAQHFCDAQRRGYCFAADPDLPGALRAAGPLATSAGYEAAAALPGVICDDAPGVLALVGGVSWFAQRWPSAADLVAYYFARARDALAAGDVLAALLALGYCAHLLADLCVPHHAAGTIGLGHRAWEAAAAKCWNDYYSNASGPRAWWRLRTYIAPHVISILHLLTDADHPYLLARRAVTLTPSTTYYLIPTRAQALAATARAAALTLRCLDLALAA